MSRQEPGPLLRPFEELGAEFERAIGARGPRERRRWRPVAVAAAAVVVAIVVVALVARPFGAGSNDDALASVRLPDGEVVEISRAFDAEQLEALRRELARYGVELRIEEVPVNPRADGRVYSVSLPADARFDEEDNLVVDRDGLRSPIVVEVGRGEVAERGSTAGLTLFEALPQLCRLVDWDDPQVSARRLDAAGFEVRWVLVEDNPHYRGPAPTEPGERFDPRTQSPTVTAEVERPPRGTAILSVLGPGGEATDVPADTRQLLVEVSPRGAEILREHEGLKRCGG